MKVLTGPMYSGKTSALLSEVRRYLIAGKSVALFKHQMDDRYGSGEKVVSHHGTSHETTALGVSSADQLVEHLQSRKYDLVAVDEIQFFDIDTVDLLIDLPDEVIVAGLDMDCYGTPFPVTKELMARADDVVKFKAVCTQRHSGNRICGQPAGMTLMCGATPVVSDDSPVVQVGGTESYEARCKACWKVAVAHSKAHATANG